MIKKNYAIYARKSPYKNLNTQVTSEETKCQICRDYMKYSKKHKINVQVKEYIDDKYSGKDTNRPAFHELMEDIKLGLVNVVVIHKVDRLSRSLSDFIKIMDYFNEYDVEFISVTQSFDTTTSMGKLSLNLLCSFAQFERELMVERQKDRIKIAKEKGCWVGGAVPLGYKAQNKKLVIDKKAAKIVRFIFQYIAKDGSITKLRQILFDDYNINKDKNSLYRILNNTIYVGKVTHYNNVYEGQHPKLISDKLFNKVQQVLASRQTKTYEHHENPSLFRGIIYCRYCHKPLRTSFTKKKGTLFYYYICPSVLKNERKKCPLRYISEARILELLRPFIFEYINNFELKIQIHKKLKDKNVSLPDKFSELWNKLSVTKQIVITREIFAKIVVSAEAIEVFFKDGNVKIFYWLYPINLKITEQTE